MAKRKLSKDQKRKKKLAERKERKKPLVEPYEGRRYQAPEYVTLVQATEIGIREADELTDRKLNDRQVLSSLTYLVLRLRGEEVSPPTHAISRHEGGDEDLVAERILEQHVLLREREPRSFTLEDRIGVLRTLLSSVRTRSSYHGGPRGYLDFLIGFLEKTGARCEAISGDEEIFLEREEEEKD